jgi:hypothetical protein
VQREAHELIGWGAGARSSAPGPAGGKNIEILDAFIPLKWPKNLTLETAKALHLHHRRTLFHPKKSESVNASQRKNFPLRWGRRMHEQFTILSLYHRKSAGQCVLIMTLRAKESPFTFI